MTVAHRPQSPRNQSAGVRLHRFTVAEYDRITSMGILGAGEPVELIEGFIPVKMDEGPPYEVPLGIPPEALIEPEQLPGVPLRRFAVREYDRMVQAGILPGELKHELVEGWVVEKMVHNPRHDSALQRLAKALAGCLGNEWEIRLQSAVGLDDSRPEPDLVIVPGPVGRYDEHHPPPIDVVLLAEVADATLLYDQTMKLRTYARNYIVQYWIINLVARQVEVHFHPSGPTEAPAYAECRLYRAGESVPVQLRGPLVSVVPVNQLLPGV